VEVMAIAMLQLTGLDKREKRKKEKEKEKEKKREKKTCDSEHG